MQPATIDQLTQLTNQFYQHHAHSFSETRNSAWAGWQELLSFFQEKHPLKILDIGCGNGRFAQFLKQTINDFTYLGIDNSTELIQTAQRQVESKDCLFSIQDCLSVSFASRLTAKYTHLVAFGVLHHIPSQSKRLDFITTLAQLLEENGYFIISFWQPLNSAQRFNKKQLDSTQFGIQPNELEQGDLLLGWQDNSGYARYCHSFSNQEIDWYIRKMSQEFMLVKRFQADGKTGNLNQYVIWQKKE